MLTAAMIAAENLQGPGHLGRGLSLSAGHVVAGGLTRPVRFGPERYPGELFVGTNYRLSELQAALLLSQLARLDKQTRMRDANGRYLNRKLAQIADLRRVFGLELDASASHRMVSEDAAE